MYSKTGNAIFATTLAIKQSLQWENYKQVCLQARQVF